MVDPWSAWTTWVRRRRGPDPAGDDRCCRRRTSRPGAAIRSMAAGKLTLLVSMGCLAPPATAASFTLTDLGTLGGKTSVAFAINARGQVTGWSNTAASPMPRAFLYDGTAMRDLGTLGGATSVAFGLDDLGRVVGVATGPGESVSH